jgi:anti-anti-sigma regulatory factor
MDAESDRPDAGTALNLELLAVLVEVSRKLSQAASEDDILVAMALYAERHRPASMEISYVFHDAAGRPDGTEIVAAWAAGALVPDHPMRHVRFKFDSYSVSSIWYSSPHEVLLVEDVLTDPRVDEAMRHLFTEQLKKRSFVLLPLYSSETKRWHGLLTITWTEPHAAAAEEALVYAALTHTITAVVAGRRAVAGYQEALAERSNPLIPISDDIVVTPVIGSIDVERGKLLLEALLQGVSRSRAQFAVIDVTGARTMDTQAAAALMDAARALRLLGVEPVLTGIRPEVAQALVQLGVDFGGVVTLGTLQKGIAYASRKKG